MHIPENYMSPLTCGIMCAAMLPVWDRAKNRLSTELPKDRISYIGVGAAFSFLGMMFNVPLFGGTTGHAVGGTLIALLFGPDAACIAISIALLLQAVIFGDGGILSFGANCFNMAFVLPYAGFLSYSLIMKLFAEKKEKNGLYCAAAAIGSYIGINAAAFFAAIELGIQPVLFRDAEGHALYCPYDLSVSIPAMVLPHILIVGFVEAFFTVAVFSFVKKTAPDLIYENFTKKDSLSSGKSHFHVFLLIAAMIILTPLGLIAQGSAWGEWGADEIKDVITNGSALGYIPKGILNGWSLPAIIPDYNLAGANELFSYVFSAITGAALLIIIFKLISIPMKGSENDS